MKYHTKILALLSVVIGMLPFATSAAEPPPTKCVTTATEASHKSYQARLEADVAPYAQNGNAAAAIKIYREGLDTAWEAMLQPYCGDGVYGVTPFVKSYAKSADRERATFLAAVKNMAKGAVVAAPAPKPAPEPVAVVPVAPAPVVVAAPVAVKTTAKIFIAPGLQRGMRAANVKLLQAFLANRYKIATADLVTGYFGPLTEKYLIKFQLDMKVIPTASAPGAGMYGPKTAQALNGA